MNMNRYTTLKLFLLTASVKFKNSSAFGLSSAILTRLTPAQPSKAVDPVAHPNITLHVANDMDVDVNGKSPNLECADPECPDCFDDLQEAIDVMEKFPKGETEAIPTDHLAQESRVSMKPVRKEVEKDSIDHASVKELAKSDNSNNALNEPIELLKGLHERI